MNLGEIIGVSLVFISTSHGSDGFYEELCFCQNNTARDCRATVLRRNLSENDENFGPGGHLPNFPNRAERATVENGPLVLTHYIRARKFQEGIKAAKVSTVEANMESYSGFFQLNNQRTSYMFFWYFAPVSKQYVGKPDTPVIIWIQGGTGDSAMLAALRENGPVRLETNGNFAFNKWSWAERAHLIYFDSPVGAGYSFTKSGKHAKTQDKVATDLYIALRQYLRLFRLTKNPLFIVGQAYAGKTVSALGAMIHRRNQSFPVNFQGVAIGNGFVDPPNMLAYGKLLYQLGFITKEARNELRNVQNQIQTFLKHKKQKRAVDLYTKYIQHSLHSGSSFIDRVTALVSKRNFTQVRKGVNEEKLLRKYLNKRYIQDALHSTGVPFVQNDDEVQKAILPDLLKSQVRNLKLLMNNYRVLMYHGQMSVENAYPLVLDFLRKISWRDRKKYLLARRVQWRVDGELAGYFKTGGRFTELLMRNAGCRVSADQPKWAQHMINKFIFTEDFNSK